MPDFLALIKGQIAAQRKAIAELDARHAKFCEPYEADKAVVLAYIAEFDNSLKLIPGVTVTIPDGTSEIKHIFKFPGKDKLHICVDPVITHLEQTYGDPEEGPTVKRPYTVTRLRLYTQTEGNNWVSNNYAADEIKAGKPEEIVVAALVKNLTAGAFTGCEAQYKEFDKWLEENDKTTIKPVAQVNQKVTEQAIKQIKRRLVRN